MAVIDLLIYLLAKHCKFFVFLLPLSHESRYKFANEHHYFRLSQNGVRLSAVQFH